MKNIYILGPFIIWISAQLIKFAINLVKGKPDIRYLISSGGMPSAHAAVVCSLATITLLDQGFSSPLFGVTVIFAAIVMYDSFGVRRSSGEQAALINRLVGDLRTNGALRMNHDYQTLREILGHKPLEVTAGGILGIIGGLAFEWRHISERFNFITNQLTDQHMLWFGYAIALLLVVSAGLWWWLRLRYGNTKKNRQKINILLYASLMAVVFLSLILFSAYQNIVVLRTDGAALVVWAVVLVGLGWFYWQKIRQLSSDKQSADSSARRDHWLKKAKRK